MLTAFVFPGQGSQAVGMGKALAETYAPARRVFAEVDGALGQNLSGLMFEGPEAELTLTANAQPALMAVSLAAIRVLEAEAGLDIARDARFVAGHSLGEYSALAAAGALTIADAARLLRIRGEAMQRAVPVGEGAMAAIIGLDFAQVSAIAAAGGERSLSAGRDLPGRQRQWRRPGGHFGNQGGGRARDGARQGGGRQARAGAAGVGAFPLRADAAGRRRDGGGAGRRRNQGAQGAAGRQCLGDGHQDPADIRASLVAQVTGAVRWRESVLYMARSRRRQFRRDRRRQSLERPDPAHRRGRDDASSIGAPADVEAFKAARAALVSRRA